MARGADKKPSGGKRGERAPTTNLTMRLKPSILEDLKAAAARSQSSISAEIERRLVRPEQPALSEISRIVELAVRSVEQRSGGTWQDGSHIQVRIYAAVNTVLKVLLGEPLDESRSTFELGRKLEIIHNAEESGLGKLGLVFSGINPEEVAGEISLLRDLLEDRRIAAEIVNSSVEAP